VLFKLVIGLIKLIRNDLKQITDLESFKNFLRDKFTTFNDKAYLIYILILRKFEFNMEIIEKNRSLLLSKISEKIALGNKSKIERKLKKNMNETCNASWQTCVFNVESTYAVREFFIYRIDETPLISENHFDEKMIKFNKILKSNFSDNCSSTSISMSNSKNFSIPKETKSSNSSINIDNKSTDINSSGGIIYNAKNTCNNTNTKTNRNNSNSKTNSSNIMNNYSNNHTEFNENIIFDYNKKLKFRDIGLDNNYYYNNSLLERHDHMCLFKSKTKNNFYSRGSFDLYASCDDKSENQNFNVNEDNNNQNNSFINDNDHSFDCNNNNDKQKYLNKQSTYDESSSFKRTEYKNKSR